MSTILKAIDRLEREKQNRNGARPLRFRGSRKELKAPEPRHPGRLTGWGGAHYTRFLPGLERRTGGGGVAQLV